MDGWLMRKRGIEFTLSCLSGWELGSAEGSYWTAGFLFLAGMVVTTWRHMGHEEKQ